MGYTFAVRKCIHIEIITKFNLIHEREWTGETVSNICKRYGTSRKTYYKWNNRYKQKGIEGLLDVSKRPHNIKYKEGIGLPTGNVVTKLLLRTHPKSRVSLSYKQSVFDR